MLSRCIAIASMCLLLAGCLTVPPHGLGGELQKYRIVDISVEGVEGIRSWPHEEENFLKTNAVDPGTADRIRTEPAFEFPQLTQHFQKILSEKVKAELSYLVDPIFTGNRPARIVVRLRQFDVPSAARRVFVDTNAKMQADIDLVDRATNTLVLRYAGRSDMRKLVGGLATGIALAFERSDIGQAMITDYLSAYRNWLLQN